MTKTATLLLVSGGSVRLDNPFIVGDGIAGTVSGETRWFADATIDRVIER